MWQGQRPQGPALVGAGEHFRGVTVGAADEKGDIATAHPPLFELLAQPVLRRRCATALSGTDGELEQHLTEIAAVRGQLALIRPEEEAATAEEVARARVVIDRMDDLGHGYLWDEDPAVTAWLKRFRARPSWATTFYEGARLSDFYKDLDARKREMADIVAC